MRRNSQLKLLKNEFSSYGGSLLSTRKGRSRPRPISATESMHIVMRSTKATGAWSFKAAKNEKKIEQLIRKFSKKYSVHIKSLANVGNHMHLHIKLAHRNTYKPFIRSLTGAIAMAVTGANRWKPLKEKFWDRRPFSRVVRGFRAMLSLNDYIDVNQIEGFGATRSQARTLVRGVKIGPWKYRPG